MTRICWWFVDLVSRMLDPDEREAVRGDFVESGESGGHALRGVLGITKGCALEIPGRRSLEPRRGRG
jgi:hypothetical protein